MYALYSWLREADDLADEGTDPPAERARRLERFWDETREVLAGGARVAERPSSPMWPAFRESAVAHDLPLATLHEHVSGQLLDQRKVRYESFDELYDYCRRVASTVGLLCIHIWGHDRSPHVRQLAEWRGVAFQLTNILRDVREDALRGRVYLPACRATAEQLVRGADEGDADDDGGRVAVACVRGLVGRAREYYDRSRPLEGHVHRDGRACLWAMTEIYRGVFERIELDATIALRGRRVCLPRWRKAWVALRAVLA
jgi:phytoene synthase